MLGRPFRALPRAMLIVILLILLALEAAGGAALYWNNRTTKAAGGATPTPTLKPGVPGGPINVPTAYKGPPILTVQNFPRTVVAGHYETFSVRLAGLPNVLLTYSLSYPDGHTESVKVLTDGTGYSKHAFLIKFKLAPGQRAPIGIGVSYSNKLQAFTRFAVQAPSGFEHDNR